MMGYFVATPDITVRIDDIDFSPSLRVQAWARISRGLQGHSGKGINKQGG